MLKINQEKCKKCQICAKNCPIGAIAVEPGADGKKVVSITNMCVECNVCRRVCPFGAIDGAEKTEGMVQCHSCSIQCKVPVGSTGACKRYTNEGGRLVRNRALVVEGKPQIEIDPRIAKPVITAVGAGTNYPCIRPAPHIVCEKRDGVDVVTTVTEAPLSYSGVLVKLDTNTYIGEEGDTVYCEGKPVGLVHTEEYGSKMIYVGGANRLTAKDGGFATARTIVALANGEKVELTVKTADHETGKPKMIKIVCQQGVAPIINGTQETTMRIGCGSATIGLLADVMKECVDECIVIDHHVTGLFSEHLAGKEVGMTWSGVIPNATKSTVGRYFGGHGDGIGGTVLQTPRDAIKSVDMSVAHAGTDHPCHQHHRRSRRPLRGPGRRRREGDPDEREGAARRRCHQEQLPGLQHERYVLRRHRRLRPRRRLPPPDRHHRGRARRQGAPDHRRRSRLRLPRRRHQLHR